MEKLKNVVVVLLIAILLLTATLALIFYFKPRVSGIRVTSTPSASVYINGVLVGKTPYIGIHNPEQIDLKLIPDGSGKDMLPYETKINLVAGIETAVDRNFDANDDSSSGSIISFDKADGKLAGLVVITNPDGAELWIDGVQQSNTPYSLNSITTGKHAVTVKSPGYKDFSANIKTRDRLKLTFFVKLAKESDSAQSEGAPSPSPLTSSGKYVVINDTPTGFLRMRTAPGAAGDEIAELKPGDKYLYLETDSETGWYKIQYNAPAAGLPNGITGWVSNQYASIASESASLK